MLHQIADAFTTKRDSVEAFFAQKSEGLVPPVFLSCDIRNSGRKLGVVDTNLFPAGFNNLCNSYSRKTVLAFRDYFSRYYPSARKLILLIEEHTRNRFYLDNVQRLKSLLEAIGLDLRLAYLGQEILEEETVLTLSDSSQLKLQKLKTDNGVPQVKGFEADLILSNNDFSNPPPEALQGVWDKIIPSPGLGWYRRKKGRHFSLLSQVVREFAQAIGLDPWLLQCIFEVYDDIDLTQAADLEKLSQGVATVLGRISEEYKKYQIEEAPYVFVKNNSGTYGMGVSDISQPEEVLQMNRRLRNKMLSAKGGQKVNSFLIQEGIPTGDFYSGIPIEPVIYMVGHQVVGGFFRMNSERDAMSSLNARGMEFSCLCLHKLDEPHEVNFLNCAEKENLVRLSTVMARLAALASSLEMKELKES